MNNDNREFLLEGTENILNNYSRENKFKILKLASELKQTRHKLVTRGILKKHNYNIKLTEVVIVKGLNIALKFYYHNVPKGFKQPSGMLEIINEEGIVYRYNRRLIKESLNIKGYKTIRVYVDDISMSTTEHRLTAIAWIPNPLNKSTVNHINGIKTDNRVINLEWNTFSENTEHAVKNDLYNTEKMKLNGNGEKNSQAKVDTKDVIFIRRNYKLKRTKIVDKLAVKYKTNIKIIEQILNNEKDIDIERFKTSTIHYSSMTGENYLVYKFCCKDIQFTIRGEFNILTLMTKISLANKFKLSRRTINDILSRRTWDYKYC